MPELLRILLVEDEATDRLLVSTVLSRDFPHLKINEITGPKAFSEALKAGNIDLVITDYQMPWTTGLDVLMEVRSKLEDTPVIMFTGTGTEEIAVAGMKAGLDDYVLKKPAHLVRLTAAVRTALERRRERQRARAAENFSRSLFQDLPVPLFRTDPLGMVTDANEALALLVGAPARSDLIGAQFIDWLVDAEGFRALLRRPEGLQNVPLQLRRYPGGLTWVRATLRPVLDSRGGLLYREGILLDISEEKALESRLRAALDALRDLTSRVPKA